MTEATAEGITITRIFDAPREAVFRAWIEPASFADWFGGPEVEVPLETVSMDVRPGGEWRATMLVRDERGQIAWHGVYREVVEPERLVFTVSDRPGEEFELVTVDLADLGDGRTEMRFRQTGGHLDAKGYGEAAQGWNGFFARMDELLAGA